MEPVALENAAAAVVAGVEPVSACGLQALTSALRGTGPGHNARLLRVVQAVTADDVRRVLGAYLVRLFDPAWLQRLPHRAYAGGSQVEAGPA